MSVKTADNSYDHLYPPFATLLRKVITQANHETTGKHGVSHWIMEEGFRSQARQNYLYTLGRSVVNPDGKSASQPMGNIVTHLHISNHTGGMAADCYPVGAHGNIMWEPDGSIWDQFAHCVRTQHELQSGRDYPKITGGTFVDSPHVEPKKAIKVLWASEAHAFLKALGLI